MFMTALLYNVENQTYMIKACSIIIGFIEFIAFIAIYHTAINRDKCHLWNQKIYRIY